MWVAQGRKAGGLAPSLTRPGPGCHGSWRSGAQSGWARVGLCVPRWEESASLGSRRAAAGQAEAGPGRARAGSLSRADPTRGPGTLARGGASATSS